jgi:hypothetical protein
MTIVFSAHKESRKYLIGQRCSYSKLEKLYVNPAVTMVGSTDSEMSLMFLVEYQIDPNHS